jgi:hypothetical protein
MGSKNPKLKGKAGGEGAPEGGTVKGAVQFAMNPKKALAKEVVKKMKKSKGGIAQKRTMYKDGGMSKAKPC